MRALAHYPADTSIPLQITTIGSVLAAAAARHPDRAAVAWPVDGVLADLSYRELLANAADLARRLLAMVHPGDRVAVWAPNSADWLVLEYAVALTGTVLVPINPALSDDEVRFILGSSGAGVLFAATEFRRSPLAVRAASLVFDLPAPVRVLDLATWHDLPAADVRLPDVTPDALFLIQYTSGTTGRPKGAMLTQLAAFNAAALSVTRLQPGDHEVWCSPMPLHHVGGSVSMVLATLAVGGTLVLMPSFDAALALELIERTGSTVLGAVPTMVLDVLAHPRRCEYDLSTLRVVQIGGSTVSTALIARMELELGVQVSNAYGQSEAPNAAQTLLDDADDVKGATIGRVNAHREARVVDPATGLTVLVDAPGELWLRSPLVMRGYFDDEARTHDTIDADGWMRTGDLVTMDDRNVLRIVGRIRDVIIRGGENIYPAEIEAVLGQHPGVADVVVVAGPHERWGEEPVAFVRAATPGYTPSEADLEAFTCRHLAAFKVPRRWVVVEQFPLTASGKVKRFELERELRATEPSTRSSVD